MCIFAFSLTFATDNMAKDAVNGVRNAVGGAENAIENAARDISGASKNATQSFENGANNTVENSMNGDNNNDNNNNESANTYNDNGAYTATRTSTTDGANFMGMNSTTWIWVIMAIVAIGIIALVYFYSSQVNSSHYDNEQ